jgi:hypothetical protein
MSNKKSQIIDIFKCSIILGIIFFSSFFDSFSQDSTKAIKRDRKILQEDVINDKYAIHLHLGILENQHINTFRTFSGIVDRTEFSNGNALGSCVGFEFEYYPTKGWGWGLEFLYVNRGAEYKSNATIPSEIHPGTDILTQNIINTDFSFIELAPTFRWVMSEKLLTGRFNLLGSLRFAFPSVKKYSQTENILSPKGEYFIVDGEKELKRELAVGQVSNFTSILFGITVGFENYIKLNEHVNFTQRALFDYYFNNITSDKWKIFSFRFELGIRFSFGRNRESTPLELY